jgi:polysaccharide biosynthesis/export protein
MEKLMLEPIRFRALSCIRHFVVLLLIVIASLALDLTNRQAAAQTVINRQSATNSALRSLGASTNAEALERLLSTQVPAADPALMLDSARSADSQDSRGNNRDRQDNANNTENNASDQPNQTTEASNLLESDYSRRAAIPLRQVGYNLVASTGVGQAAAGSIWDDYTIGIGDEVIVTLRGNRNATTSVSVDREGRITLPDAPPFAVAGRSFSDVVDQINRVVADNFGQTTAFVSLGSIRAISVTVAGEVGLPGRYVFNSLTTLTDALAQAGGVRRSGTLRKIRVTRGTQSWTVDLYPLLLRASASAENPRLEDGDRVVVDTLGPHVAVVGDVIRAGIYELLNGQPETAQDIIAIAGGLIRNSGNAISLQRLNESGLDQVRDLPTLSGVLRKNDIVRVEQSTLATDGFLTLAGNVVLPGRRTISSSPTLYSLLDGGQNLGENTYTLFAILETSNPTTFLRQYVPINLIDILARRVDIKLESGDAVYIFSRSDIDFLSSDSVLSIALGDVPRSSNVQCQGLTYLNGLVAKGYIIRTPFDKIVSNRNTPFVLPCPNIFNEKPDLLPALLNTSVSVSGEIRKPGLLPIAQNTSLPVILEILGGITNTGDPSYIEILHSSAEDESGWRKVNLKDLASHNILLNPFDSVRVARRDNIQNDGYVILRGEVKRPGRYGITHGEKMSDILTRAGGLTTEAYPYGAVFQRQSVQAAERAAYARAAAELRSTVPFALTRSAASSNGDTGSVISAVQLMMTQIENTPAVGRVVIESDPLVLQVRPDADFYLEDGDILTVPKRPAHVTVSGEVLLPTAVRFVSGATPMDYIRQAGGATPQADIDRAFVLLPNGIAERVQSGFLGGRNSAIPPGSTIVVPRDAAPLDLLALSRDTLSILSSFALSAASLAVIARDY